MSVLEQIQKDMYAAMKAGEKEKAGTLRTTLAKLKDKRIEKREALSESEEIPDWVKIEESEFIKVR